MEKAYFANCIIYGGAESELGLDSFPTDNQFNYQFENCLIKVAKEDLSILKSEASIINPTNFQFKDLLKYNYELDTLSVAKDAGSIAIDNLYPLLLLKDLNGNARNIDKAPDLGAYERKN
jgi:hypothetical protein